MSAKAARSIGHVRADFQNLAGPDAPPAAPPPPVPDLLLNNNVNESPLLNRLSTIHSQALGECSGRAVVPPRPSAWGRMARWERKERVGDMVALVGEFVTVGTLAGTVFDGQEVRCPWDVDNHASFALIKQTEEENFEDVWLYNR